MLRNSSKQLRIVLQNCSKRGLFNRVAPYQRKNQSRNNQDSELATWNAFSDPFFSDPFFRQPFGSVFGELAKASDMKFPEVDISRTEDGLKIEANVPGYKKDQVNIDLDGRWLTISGEMKEENKKDNKNYHVMERKSGSFSRRFHLPEDAKLENIQAKMDEGVLVLQIPTESEAQSEKKKIEIA